VPNPDFTRSGAEVCAVLSTIGGVVASLTGVLIMQVSNPSPIPPKKTISEQIWSWVVVGWVAALLIGGGIGIVTASVPYHVWIADAFFFIAAGLFVSKFLTWEDAKQQEASAKRKISAVVGVCTLSVLVILVGGNHYLNRPLTKDTAVRLKVEENQLVSVFGKISVLVDALKGA
jgi:hypothetical protein